MYKNHKLNIKATSINKTGTNSHGLTVKRFPYMSLIAQLIKQLTYMDSLLKVVSSKNGVRSPGGDAK